MLNQVSAADGFDSQMLKGVGSHSRLHCLAF
jgi:hypothetical protein